MPKVYFAGPDVFRADYDRVIKEIRTLCAKHGIEPLLPGDAAPGRKKAYKTKAGEARAIYRENLAHIKNADGVVANLSPFRGGIEPDSGTAFEVGHAAALGKWVVGYLDDLRSLPERVKDSPLKGRAGRDRDGFLVEDWDHPVNLMIAMACDRVVGTLGEAVEIAGKRKAPRAASKRKEKVVL
jgi:nucleoside 2-deoxyribosyltransferase